VPAVVTLTTDIGWEYAAQMKAVLYTELPPGHVVDLTHELRPHAIVPAAFLLPYMTRRFPRGSVHLVVVDPGVGGRRAPIAIRTRDGSHLVGPDNGVLWPLARQLGFDRAVRLRPAAVAHGRRPSATFEGRELFAPAAARLARGAGIDELGAAHRPQVLNLPRPRRAGGSAYGRVAYVDRFGNLITNIPTRWRPLRAERAELRLDRQRARLLRWAPTYEALARGAVGLVGSSFGLLEVAAREASAAERLGVGHGSRALVRWLPRPAAPRRRASVK
jgi:S-adenosyl-L-methionine hydrolase (adenosine-forming)